MFVNGVFKTFADSLINLGGIVSTPVAFFMSKFLRISYISSSVGSRILNEKFGNLFLMANILSWFS